MLSTRIWRAFLRNLLQGLANRVPKKRFLTRLRFEQLDDRVVPTTIIWNNPNGGNWDVGSNWLGGNAPGNGDTAVIDTTSAATITIQSGDSIDVQGISSNGNATLSITGGSLEVTSGASILNGALTMTGGTLEASGLGVFFTANGATTVSGASLYAESGASLSLPGMTSYSQGSGTTTLEATGTGSNLTLANLTSVTETANGYQDQIQFDALAGGTVTLSALQQIDTGTVTLESDGSGSELNVSALTSFAETDGWTYSVLQASNAGTVSDGDLASISVIDLNVIAASEDLTLTTLTSIYGSNITVSGGASLSLSGVTSETSGVDLDTTLEATGTGSVLTLANLATVTETANGYQDEIQFEALAGGTVTLSSLQQIDTGTVVLESDGSGSELNVSALNSFAETGGWTYSTLQASNAGTVSDGALASVSVIDLNVSGASEDLSLTTLTSIDGSNITVSGGASLSLPGVASDTSGEDLTTTLEATGTGSVLTLANLTSVTETASGYQNQIQFEALAGGTVTLSALEQINTGTVLLVSDGSGSELGVSALTSFAETGGWTYSTLQASNGGIVSDGALASLSNISLNVSGATEDLTLTNLTSFNGIDITVSGGATLSLPGVTSYSGMPFETTVEATGTGSVLTLANLTAVTEAHNGYQNQIEFEALAGAALTLSGLQQIDTGTVVLESDGSGSELNVPALTSFAETGGWEYSTLQASNGATVADGSLANLTDVGVYISGTTDNMSLGGLSSLDNDEVTIDGAGESYTLPGVTSFDAASITVSGGALLSLPGVTSYAGVNYTTTLEATGTGSVLTLANMATVTEAYSGYQNQSQFEALAGGTVTLSSLQQIDTGTVVLVGDGSGSELNLLALTSFAETGGWTYSVLQASNGGTVSDGDLASLSGVSLNVSGDTEDVTLTKLTSINGIDITVSGGGTLSLPGVTSYLGMPYITTLEATGTGSVLTLANLTTLTEAGTGYQNQIQYEALAGGTLTLSGLKQVDTGTVVLESDGSGSDLDVQALTSFTETGGWTNSVLQASTGGTVADGDLASLSDINLTISGTSDNISLSGLSSFDNDNVSISGAGEGYTLPGVTSFDGANVTVSGGAMLSLPGVTSYAGINNLTTIEATGTGSVLTLANLTTVTQAYNGYDCVIQFEALAGSTLTLTALQGIDTGTVVLESDGSGSDLDISSLTSFAETDGVEYSTLQASNDGTISNGDLSSLSNIDLNVSGANGTLTFTGPTSLDYVNITVVDGGTLSSPQATSIIGSGNSITINDGGTFQFGSNVLYMPASGAGITITVPQMPSGLAVYLGNTDEFTGGTTFDVAPGDDVILGGDYNNNSYTGGVTFNVGLGAVVNLTGGDLVTYGGTLTGSGAGTVQINRGGVLYPAVGGVTFDFPGNMFQWTGGEMELSIGNVTNLGTINLSGPNDTQIYADGTLYDYGTIIQSGAGDFGLHSDNIAPTTLLIEPGGQYLLESNAGIINAGLGYNVIDNEGLIRKTAGSGTSTLTVPSQGYIANTGTIEADSGTLALAASITQVSGGDLTGGTWNALDGATLEFPTGTTITSSAANIALGGAGASISGLSDLAANSGSFAVSSGASFTTAGNFTNSGTLTLGGKLDVKGNYSQLSNGSTDEQIGGAPASGEFGQTAATGTAALAGTFNLSLVNGFVPQAGEAFPVMTFTQASGSFATISGLGSSLTSLFTPTSFDLTNASGNPVDLATSTVTAPTSATDGQSITVAWQVTNQSSNAATGNWQDSVYLSTTSAITSSSVFLGSVQHVGGLAAGDSYPASLSASLPGLPPGNYYVIVEADSLYQLNDTNRADGITTAPDLLAVSLPAITLGTPLSGSFSAGNEDQYYQLTVPAGGSLTLTLTSAASSGATALYVSQGVLPTAYNSQYVADIADQPNQTLTVPQVLTAGTYYILVEGVSGAAAAAGFTLTASQTGAFAVSSISSYAGGNAGNVTIEVDGTNFTPQTTATLSLGGTTLPDTAVYYESASQLYATFDLTGAAVGGYTLSVQQGAETATAATPFQVIAAKPNDDEVWITLGDAPRIRSGRTAAFIITYTNKSAEDMTAPLLQVTTTSQYIGFSTPDDPNAYVSSAELLAVSQTGPAGILRPGQSGRLTVTLLSEGSGRQSVPLKVGEVAPQDVIHWPDMEASAQPATIPAAAWSVVWGNLMATVGTDMGEYETALANAATYLGSLGESTAHISDVANLWSFLVSQADDYYPAPLLTTAVDASLPTPGSLSLSIDRVFEATISGRNTTGIFGLGWTTPWQTSLTADPKSGDVVIDSGGNYAVYTALPNGTYLDTSGGSGTLTLGLGDVYTFTAANGTAYVFLADGLLGYEQDATGNRITLGYNANNQPDTLTYSNPADPSEPTEQLALSYNTQGFVSQVADGTGNVWTYTYDLAGHLLSVAGPGGMTTAYAYDTGSNPETANALLSVTNPDGSQQNYTYDPATGRLTGTSAKGGANPISYTYPDEAEVTATDAAGDQTTVWYNDLGLAGRIETPLEGVSTYTYDVNGNMIGYTDAAGDSYQYSYDANGNLTQIVNPLGQATLMSYGPMDDLTSVTDGDGNTTQYSYNSGGNLLDITYPDGTHESFTYDPLGNLSETIEQTGNPISYQYNSDGLVTEEAFADGTSETFTYDSHGNLLTASTYAAGGGLTGTTTITYNAANEVLSVEYPNGLSLTFTYNAGGQRTQSVDQSGYIVNYVYDSLGRLSELTDSSGNPIVQYTYNAVGSLVKKVNGNGTYTTYAYDADDNLLSEVNYADPSGNTVNSSFTYTYNLLDEETSMTDAAGDTTTYTYDPMGQLTGVTLPDGGGTITYEYNAAGDRTEVIDNGQTTSYTSNSDNEITTVGSATYTYDADGNLATVTDASGTTTYTYNQLNQLVSITNPDGSEDAFQYSPLGFMVGESSTTSGGATTQTNYLVDPTGDANVVGAYTGSGSLIADYTYGNGLVSTTGPSGTGYYDFDASGNTAGITGSAGTYVNQYSYLPFGETTTVSAALPNPFTFAGEVGVVQTGDDLFYMRAREYTPETGQFMSNDPIGLAGGDANIRRYVDNHPLVGVDPTGLSDSSGGGSSNGPSQFFGFSGGLGLSLTLGVTVNSNGDSFLTTGVGGTTGGVTLYSVAPSASAGESTDYSGTIGGTFGGVTAHNSFSDSGYSPSLSADVGFKVPGFSVNHFWNIPLGNVFTNKYKQPHTFLLEVSYSDAPEPQPQWVCTNDKPDGDTGPSFNCDSDTCGGGSDCSTGSSTASHDPNSLVGPAGLFVSAGRLGYALDFENDGGVAAQVVTATEQLDSNLDWSTFQLGSFGFGPVTVAVPAGLTQYQTTVSYENIDGTPLNVLVDLDFDVQTGLLTATFTSIDPLTGQTPAGVTDGFLYPNNASGVGEGFIQYTVGPEAGLAQGTAITGQAAVVFDTNPAIQTNTVTNELDVTPPTSSVAPLNNDSPTSFNVNWSGDDSYGPGIAYYSVYVSVNGGAYTPWQKFTTATSATYAGTVGDTYSFYSIAYDDAGMIQPTPSEAQASTIVVPTDSTVSLSASSVAAGNPVTVTLQAKDDSGNDIDTTGLTVVFELSNASGGQGTFSAVTDNGNGTYTATFTGTLVGANSITTTVDGAAITTSAAPIAVTPGAVDAANSTLKLSAPSIQLGGIATIAIQALDAYGNADPTGVNAVDINLGGSVAGTLSSVTSDGNGIYTATYTGTADGGNTILATIKGSPVGTGSPPSVTVSGNAVSVSKSKITLSSSSVESGNTITVKLQAEDAKGNKETAGGLTVLFSLVNKKSGGQGTFSAVTDNGNGTYTATFTGVIGGSNTITATIASVKGTVTAIPIKVTAGAISLAKSVVKLSVATVKAGSKVTVTLQPEDAAGNKLILKGLDVVFTLGGGIGQGTFSTKVTYNSNGTYTATFTGTKAGLNTITATIGGEAVTSAEPSITVTPGAASVKESVVTATPETVAVGGAITVMLQAEDEFGNDETTGGLVVAFTLGSGTGKGTFGKVTYAGNGMYTVKFTATAAGANTILATIGGAKVTTAAPEITIG